MNDMQHVRDLKKINIQMISANELCKDNNEFNLNPFEYGYRMVTYSKTAEIFNLARQMATKIDGICVAVINDFSGKYVLGNTCKNGLSRRFLLFNAEKSDKENGEIRAITFNTNNATLTRYWFDCWVQYKRGAVL